MARAKPSLPVKYSRSMPLPAGSPLLAGCAEVAPDIAKFPSGYDARWVSPHIQKIFPPKTAASVESCPNTCAFSTGSRTGTGSPRSTLSR